MKFGYFDDTSREYVITTPRTPRPWINYLGTEDFFGLISNTAGGYCFYKDARLRRLIRYRYNNVPTDYGGRYFYIVDGDTVWNPGWQPVQTELDDYQCRHGLGYTQISGVKNGVQAAVLYLVPLGENCEIHRVSIKNLSSRPKRLILFSLLEFCLWNAYDDMTNFQRNFSTGEVEVENGTIYHKTEYRERRNHYSFYSVNRSVAGFDTDRDAFLGPYRGFHNPQAVFSGQATNSIAHGWAPIASHQINLELEPGEGQDLIFVLGYVENDPQEKWEEAGVINKEKARALTRRFAEPESVDTALAGLKKHWAELLASFQVESGMAEVDRMANTWNPYQCMITFDLARSASYFESGIGRGIGFRDSNQDILGVVAIDPESVRQRILDLAATQFPDGSAYHQYQPLTRQGNNEIGGGFNDDPLWLLYSVIAYIKETGDYGVLEEPVPFNDDPSTGVPLIEHLRRSLQHVSSNLGPHGLPLIGRADWNDCLNLNSFSSNPDESFQTCETRNGKTAESVLIAAMFVDIGQEYVRLCEILGYHQEARTVETAVNKMRQAIRQYGYDGRWFLRAYDAAGHKVGSRQNGEGKIFIEPQGFCVMAGIGLDDGTAAAALDSVRRLLATKHGIKLLHPPYSRYYLELGEISSYPPGYKENGGIFCHNNPWVIIAETRLGRSDIAFDYYRKTSPAYRESISEVHQTEPYVYSQMIAGSDASRPGEAKNSWLTGAAAWHYVALTQYIFGIRPDFNGLTVDPCLPAGMERVEVRRKFRGVDYQITIHNRNRGRYRLAVRGEEVEGKLIGHNPDNVGKTIHVECEI